MRRKILSNSEIFNLVPRLKKEGKKVVTLNGSFDILHSGHVSSFIEAKNHGDVLIVLLNSDRSIKLYKGPLRPIISEKHRIKMVAALESVDYVTIFDDINPKKILSRIGPDIHCNGSSWGKNCVEREVVEHGGGRIYILKDVPGISTSAIVERILRVYSKKAVKAIFINLDILINKGVQLRGVQNILYKLSMVGYKIIAIGSSKNTFKASKLKVDKFYTCSLSNTDVLLRAVRDLGISLNDSWIISDDFKDVVAGRETNTKVIKIGSKIKGSIIEPNFYDKNLLKATSRISK